MWRVLVVSVPRDYHLPLPFHHLHILFAWSIAVGLLYYPNTFFSLGLSCTRLRLMADFSLLHARPLFSQN